MQPTSVMTADDGTVADTLTPGSQVRLGTITVQVPVAQGTPTLVEAVTLACSLLTLRLSMKMLDHIFLNT